MVISLALALMLAAHGDAATVQKWARKAKPFTTCTAGADCDEKWERAANWIRDNTRFKIEVDQPGILSTPGAIYANTDLSFTLTKTDRGDGRFDLNVYAWCGNVISCIPKPKTAIAKLKQAVEAPQ